MARYFDGVSSALTGSAGFLSGAAAFTIHLYWHPTSLTTGAQGLLYCYSGGNNWRVLFDVTANAVTFDTTGHTGATDPATSSDTAAFTDAYDGKHVMYRYDGAAWVVWTSSRTGGIVKKTINAAATFALPTVTATTVGFDGTNYADGTIAEVALWDYALSDTDAEWLMRGVSASSFGRPVAYWPLRGTTDPEPDYMGLPSLSGGTPLTVATATQVAHPRVIGPDYVRDPQAAWAVEIQATSGTVRAATSDLTDPVDVDVLGAVYPQRIVDAAQVVVSKSIESGVVTPGTTTLTIQNDRHALPDQLSGLSLWLEADKIRTAAAGADVATWVDQSGRGLNAVAYGGGATGPAFQAAGVNGLPSLRFAATADSLALASGGTAVTGTDYTVVVVFTRADTDTGSHFVMSGVGGSWSIYTASGRVRLSQNGTADLDLGAVKAINTPYVLSYVHRNGGDGFGRLDQGEWQNAAATRHPGTRPVFGTSNTPASDLDGDICVALIYNRALSVDELTKLENYLAAKYADAAVPHGTLTRNNEWRGVRTILRRYERSSHELVTELVGQIADVDWTRPGEVTLTVTGAKIDKLDERIPKALVTVDEFPESTDLLAPIPVGFGQFWVSAPYVAFEELTGTNPGHQDFLVSHVEDADGADMAVRVESVKTDIAPTIPGLELVTGWYQVGGTTPTKHSTTVLQLSDNFSTYYTIGMPLKITISGVDYYTHVAAAYGTAGTNRVTVADAVIASNPSAVYALAGAYELSTSTYATGTADLLSLRLVGVEAGGGLVVFAKNHTLSNPAVVIKEILRNSVWGLGQSVDAGTFAVAAVDYVDASLDSACNNALGADRQQRAAKEVLAEILGLRGAWLELGEDGEWEIYVDTVPAFDQVRTFGLGDGTYNNIERINRHIRQPLGQAVKTLKLRFRKKGRARSAEGVTSWLAPTDYELQVNSPVLAVGTDRVETNPWLQRVADASRVCAYRGKRLAAEDEAIDFIAGFAGRNVQIGEVVRTMVPHSQVDASYRVIGYERALRGTALRTVGYSAGIFDFSGSDVTYDDGVGANTSTDTVATDSSGRMPTFGPNLVANAGFGETGAAYAAGDVVTNTTFLAYGNNGWRITETEGGVTSITAATVVNDISWVGSRYLSMVIAATTGTPQLYTLAPIEVDKAYFASIYVGKSGVSNPQDVRGWYMLIQYYTALGVQVGSDYQPTMRTSGETTGAGTAYRWFATFRPPSTAAYALMAIRYDATGTYYLAGGAVNRVDGFSFVPPPWQNTSLGS